MEDYTNVLRKIGHNFRIERTKKRLFLMTPLHHHFEKKGYSEPDIVKAFWLVGIIFSLAGIFFALWI